MKTCFENRTSWAMALCRQALAHGVTCTRPLWAPQMTCVQRQRTECNMAALYSKLRTTTHSLILNVTSGCLRNEVFALLGRYSALIVVIDVSGYHIGLNNLSRNVGISTVRNIPQRWDVTWFYLVTGLVGWNRVQANAAAALYCVLTYLAGIQESVLEQVVVSLGLETVTGPTASVWRCQASGAKQTSWELRSSGSLRWE